MPSSCCNTATSVAAGPTRRSAYDTKSLSASVKPSYRATTLSTTVTQIYGKQIRLIGGQLNGFEGRLMSKRGSKQKRLLIDLKECNLSASIQVESDYIQLLE